MKCFDCKFSVMLMFCLSYRIGRIYICLICKVGATRGCGFLFASARSTLETLDCLFFFNTCYSIYFIPANAFCDVMCILAVIIIL